MKKKNFSAIWIVLILFVLTAACSKKLMPPEIEATGGLSESGFEETAQEEQGFGAGDEPGFGEGQGYADEPRFGEDSGFPEETAIIRDEDIGDGDISRGPGGVDEVVPGNGSAGAFEAEGAGPGAMAEGRGTIEHPDTRSFEQGRPGGEEVDQARLFSYRSTAELKDVHFEFDRYDLDERSRTVLEENANFLKQHPSVRVEIQGHCDERGTNNYNLALGQRRANSTKRYLASLGIPETRMHVISYGEEKPFCAESNENCWWRNRRAHFLLAR